MFSSESQKKSPGKMIIIPYLEVGGAHKMVADSLKKAADDLGHKCHVEALPADHPHVGNDFFSRKIKRPLLQRLHNFGDTENGQKTLMPLFKSPMKLSKMRELLLKYPDAEFLPLNSFLGHGLVREREALKKKGKLAGENPFIAQVVTDFDMIPRRWYVEKVDMTIVPDDQTKKRLMELGCPENCIRTSPYAVPDVEKFKSSEEIDALKMELEYNNIGYPEGKTIGLCMSGIGGDGNFEQVVMDLAKKKLNTHLVVVTGTNERLEKRLIKHFKKNPSEYPTTVKIFGHRKDIPHLMDLADYGIGKAGGGTTAMSRNRLLPWIACDHLPNELGNKNTIEREETGIVAKTIDQAIDFIKKPENFENYRKAGFTNGATDIINQLPSIENSLSSQQRRSQQSNQPQQGKGTLQEYVKNHPNLKKSTDSINTIRSR